MLAKESAEALTRKLRSVPLFSAMKDKQLKAIANGGKQLSYPEGKVIVQQGEMGVSFFLILEGAVEVRRKGKLIAKLGSGNFFGEMSLLDNNPRVSDVVAAVPTTCLVLSTWEFRGLVRSDSEIAMTVLQTLSHRLRESDKSLDD